jgi:hypothetical protein
MSTPDSRTEHERFAAAFLQAVGGGDCVDHSDEHPDGTPGVWLPRAAWLAIVEQMREGRAGVLASVAVN